MRSFTIVYVDDVPRLGALYRDLLGFGEMYRFPDTDDPGRNPVHIRGPVR